MADVVWGLLDHRPSLSTVPPLLQTFAALCLCVLRMHWSVGGEFIPVDL